MSDEQHEDPVCDHCGNADHLRDLIASQAVQMERLGNIDAKLDKCVVGLYGPDHEPEKGLIVRVDRLERSKASMVKALWAVFAGVAGLAAKAIAALVGIKP